MKKIFYFWLIWKISIFAFALMGIVLLPLQSIHYLGGSIDNYSTNPLFWGWANFDGDYYLKIATQGYQPLTHSFFPLYPLIIEFLTTGFSKGMFSVLIVGFIISNLAFLASLFLFWKLVQIDYPEKIAKLSIILLLVFPTSFYFGAVYTESLFLLFVLGSFFAARKGGWFLGGVLGALASATRVTGILLLPALIFEWWQQKKEGKANLWQLLLLFPVPFGLFLYMLFLKETIGDPLAFYKELVIFGEQRSTEIILLYQVFWRYIKMLVTVDFSNPIYLTILLEALTGAGGFVLLVVGYLRKMRPSYLSFSFLSYILPTLTGSFSSMPRYVLVIFPLFILAAIFLSEHKKLATLWLIFSILLLALETMLFIRGYWVA